MLLIGYFSKFFGGKKHATIRENGKRRKTTILALELLEERAVPTTSWNNFNGNAQHTGISTVAAQNTDRVLWQTSVNLEGSYFWHTGEPVFTPNNTVIVPVKITSSGQEAGANFELEAFNGNTGVLLWTATSDYTTPSYSWLPPYQPAYDPVTDRVYFAGNGGTLYYISNPDNPGSSTPTPMQVAFYGISNYAANPSAYNASIYINTPLTVDTAGNVFFGFSDVGSNPSGISDGGVARVTTTGAGAYVLGGAAIGGGLGWTGTPAIGSAPAVSNDGSTVYVAINGSTGPNLVGLNAITMTPEYWVVLSIPNAGTGVGLISQSTAAPMVAPDGSVFMGVFANSYDGSRGFMTHYSGDLATEYTPGAFGWDDTASIIPTSMVPSYSGASSYLILTKYNNYVAGEVGSSGGDGVNEIAILDPYATEIDPNNDPNPSLLVMKEIMTVTSPTEDSGWINDGYPDATREWCTNGTAVDPATDSVFINNEDGYSYRWNLATGTLTQAVEITNGYGEPYTPTAIGPDGAVYALNGGTLFALGGYTNYTLTNVSALTPSIVGQSVAFTTTLASTSGGAVPTGSITYSYTSGTNNPLNSTPVFLGTAALVNGQASLTTSSLVPNHYHIIATYSGDLTDGYSPGSTTLVQVVLANPTTTVSASASSVDVGGSVTFTATVNPDGIFFVPLGTVTFMDGSTVLATVPLNALDQWTASSSSQLATFTTSSLGAGIHSITTVYSGDLNFAGGTSSIFNETVVATTTTTLSDNGPNPSNWGDAVSFTATVSGGLAINGETVFIEDASNANAVVASPTLSGSTVTFTISNLSMGSHHLFAVYNGDPIHSGSNDSGSATPVIQVVNNDGSAPLWVSDVVNGGAPQYVDQQGQTLDISNQNSVVLQILVTFNEPVTLAPGAFSVIPFSVSTDGNVNPGQVLVNSGPNPNQAEVDLNAPIQVGDGHQWIVTFANSAGTHANGLGAYLIDDGVYTLHIDHTKVTGNAQTMAADNNTGFWALYGDVTYHHISGVDFNVGTGYVGDGYSDASVGSNDFAIFKQHYNADSSNAYAPPYYYLPLDYDLDGSDAASDFTHFKINYNADWQF
jgi:Bacterial Ig-like domain (group 3)